MTTVFGAVSALAALGALVFAYLTVRETRDMRTEEQRARRLRDLQRVSEMAGEVGDAMLRGLQGSHIHMNVMFPIAQRRLAAALAAVPDELPACRSMTKPEPVEIQTDWSYEEVREAVTEALNEVTKAIEGG